jgi:HK97 family phage prohead protease
MKYQHQPDSVLARYRPDGQRNSLHFNVDERGVHFNFKAKQKDAGILEDIQNGDLSACSFSFKVPTEKGAERWEKRSDGTYLRTINKFSKVADFSIVITPAYPQTMVSTRGLDELRQSEELEAQKVREAQEAIDLQKAKDKEALELKSKQDKEAQAAIEAQKAKEKEKAMADYYRAFEDKINKLKK